MDVEILKETASELNVEITFSPDGKVYVFDCSARSYRSNSDHIEHCYVAETEEDLVSILEGFEVMNKFKVKV